MLGTLALPWVFHHLPLLFDQMRLVDTLDQQGVGATAIFVLLHIVATVMGVPGVVLTIVGGIFFGLVWGSLWSWVGATLGAIAAFWVARYLLHNWAERRIHDRKLLSAFNQAIQRYPFSFVLIVRFAPISPFNLVNFLFGLTKIHWFPYSLGTLIGIIPGVVAYTWLGVTGEQAIQGQGTVPFLITCCLLALMSALPLLIRRRGLI